VEEKPREDVMDPGFEGQLVLGRREKKKNVGEEGHEGGENREES